MPVPVMNWLGERIAFVDSLPEGRIKHFLPAEDLARCSVVAVCSAYVMLPPSCLVPTSLTLTQNFAGTDKSSHFCTLATACGTGAPLDLAASLLALWALRTAFQPALFAFSPRSAHKCAPFL
jgi:hypothetical protein